MVLSPLPGGPDGPRYPGGWEGALTQCRPMGRAGKGAGLSPGETQKDTRHALKPHPKAAITTAVWYRQKGGGTGH